MIVFSYPCSVPSLIVALGGISGSTYLSSGEIFSSISQVWTPLPNMTTKRGDIPIAFVVNKTNAIVCGGSNDGNNGLSSCETLALTNLTGGWKLIASMSAPRIFSSGAFLADNDTFLVTGSTCEKFATGSSTWSSASNLSLGSRVYHSSILFTSYVIVMGGQDTTGATLNTCEKYDDVLNTWSSFPSFSTAREIFGAAVMHDIIYIAGGWNGGTSAFSSVEVYNGTTWSFLPSSLAQTRSGCVAFGFQDRVVVLGGFSRTTIEVFDPITSTWNTTFPAMKTSPSRRYLTAISFEDIIMASTTPTTTTAMSTMTTTPTFSSTTTTMTRTSTTSTTSSSMTSTTTTMTTSKILSITRVHACR